MKKLFVLGFSIFLMMLFIANVSAFGFCNDEDYPEGKTLVAGKIYEEATGDRIEGAEVEVICHGEGGDISEDTQSGPLGIYKVLFSQEDCDLEDSVTVNAEKDGLTGTSEGTIKYHLGNYCLDLDIGIIHVPLIPEFGIFIGALTMLGAVAVFFVIRRR